jgi:hypothetical protein
MARRNYTSTSMNYFRIGTIADGNVTAIEVYHDKWRNIQELYIAVNKTNLTFTLVYQVTIYPLGNFTVRNPPFRV